jgi:3-phenylpropionate/trans-cinnamate dioxygenase ferredoxin subunit
MMAWRRVAAVADIKIEEAFPFELDGKEFAIYRLGDDYHVLEDVCPHAYALLSSGLIDGEIVECPLHQAQFHIPTGKCLGGPATQGVNKVPVRIENEDVLVDL